MKLYISEKPSQAADVANVLGITRKNDGYYETHDGIVTYCLGHLLEFANPEAYGEHLQNWSFEDLPIVPGNWITEVKESASKQYKIISKLIQQASEVVIATDADREGESIAREILEACGYSGTINRLWLSSLDEKSVRKALDNILPGTKTLPLYHASVARSKADWLVGMNMTRAATTKLRKYNESGVLSIGRVQTPTLNLVVTRDLLIENFTAVPFYDLDAEVINATGEKVVLSFAPKSEEKRIFEKSQAEDIIQKSTGCQGPLKVVSEEKSAEPTKLFRLSSFQKQTSAAFGWSAAKALEVAQSLYEKHKATTYPRSDCQFLPQEQESDIPVILENLKSLDCISFELEQLVIRKSVFDTQKVTAHHAIIPTTQKADTSKMSADELKAFKLIALRYIANLMPAYVFQQTVISIEAAPAGITYQTTGTTPKSLGWRSLEGHELNQKEKVLPVLTDGETGTIEKVVLVPKKTSPPKRYTEGTLIDDMEAVAKFVTDPDLKKRLKETSGLGTEATRGNIIETLKTRGFLVPEGKNIVSSRRGRNLISRINSTIPEILDPGKTALWEQQLDAIAVGEADHNEFIRSVESRLDDNLRSIGEKDISAMPEITCPLSGSPVEDKGSYYFFPGQPDVKFYKRIGEKFIEPEIYLAMLSKPDRKSELISGFVGQKGKAFSAFIKLDGEKVVYDFDGVPKPKRGGSGKRVKLRSR